MVNEIKNGDALAIVVIPASQFDSVNVGAMGVSSLYFSRFRVLRIAFWFGITTSMLKTGGMALSNSSPPPKSPDIAGVGEGSSLDVSALTRAAKKEGTS